MTDLAATVVPAHYLMAAPPFTPTPKPANEESLRDVLTVTRRDRDAALADVEQLRAALIQIGRAVGCLVTDGAPARLLANIPAHVDAKLKQLGFGRPAFPAKPHPKPDWG